MPELRQDPTTKEWVIIATERAKRPDQFRELAVTSAIERKRSSCPFCPGNEQLTSDEVFALRNAGGKGQFGWRVRVVPNKFAALNALSEKSSNNAGAFFHNVPGYGHHEVIIESPQHNEILPLMSEQQFLEDAYVLNRLPSWCEVPLPCPDRVIGMANQLDLDVPVSIVFRPIYSGNSSACCQNAHTSKGRQRIRRSAWRAW